MTQQDIFAGENRDQAGAAHDKTQAVKPLLYGPAVGLAIALAFALLVTGQILMFLYYYGDSLADTRLPYVENFSADTRLDYRQYGGQWRVEDEKLVQFDTQDTDLLAVLPNLEIPAGEPYAFKTKIQVLTGPIGGGIVFNMQDPESRAMSQMVRFGTGDLSAILPGLSPCGRTAPRIQGWMGRADQRTKIKGMFVDPKQVAEILKAHPEIGRARLVVSRSNDADVMTLRVEPAAGAAPVASDIEATLTAIAKLRGTVEIVAPSSLPNDGKVIADERDYTA